MKTKWMTWSTPSMVWAFCVVFAGMAIADVSDDLSRLDTPRDGEDARKIVFKQTEDAQGRDVDLTMFVFAPEDHDDDQERPAIVFFFGGGWNSGSPSQFFPFCRYLASRGMVAAAAEYRVKSRHGVQAEACVRDAKSAVRYLRRNADTLGIDPDRIAAGGGSAGGHLAAATATVPGFDQQGESTDVSARPNALVLFNPAVVLAPVGDLVPLDAARQAGLKSRLGDEPKELSPYHHVTKDAPPTIIFHGTGDTTVPYATVELFQKKMQQMGNRCDLVGFDDRPHGFFNFGRGGGKDFEASIRAMDDFLTELGYLEPSPSRGDPSASAGG